MAYVDYSDNKEEFQEMVDYCKSLGVGDKMRYTVKAKSDRYLICTKPFSPQKTVLYTIIDLKRLVRGTNNLVFNGYDYAVQEDIDECLKDLEAERGNGNWIEVSHRNCILLNVEMPKESEAG